MDVAYTPQFRRQFRKLPKNLQNEVFEKIELFRITTNHEALRVHKLKGSLDGRYSFSVNYRYRIVFLWEKKNTSAILLAVGDHAVYD